MWGEVSLWEVERMQSSRERPPHTAELHLLGLDERPPPSASAELSTPHPLRQLGAPSWGLISAVVHLERRKWQLAVSQGLTQGTSVTKKQRGVFSSKPVRLVREGPSQVFSSQLVTMLTLELQGPEQDRELDLLLSTPGGPVTWHMAGIEGARRRQESALCELAC